MTTTALLWLLSIALIVLGVAGTVLPALPGTVLVLAREWGITWMRVAMLKYGVMAAAAGGKLKTLLQAIALLMFLPYPIGQTMAIAPFWGWLAWLVMGAAFVLTAVTGVMYVFDALRLKAESTAGSKR